MKTEETSEGVNIVFKRNLIKYLRLQWSGRFKEKWEKYKQKQTKSETLWHTNTDKQASRVLNNFGFLFISFSLRVLRIRSFMLVRCC